MAFLPRLALPTLFAALAGATTASPPAVTDIGSRLELFVDRHLVDRLDNLEFQTCTNRFANPCRNLRSLAAT